jgi:hypothetical protein
MSGTHHNKGNAPILQVEDLNLKGISFLQGDDPGNKRMQIVPEALSLFSLCELFGYHVDGIIF